MDKGDFAGKELLEIQNTNPTWYSRLEKDPFTTRYVRMHACVKIILKKIFDDCFYRQNQMISTQSYIYIYVNSFY